MVLPKHCEVVMLHAQDYIYMNCKDVNSERGWLNIDVAYALLPKIQNVRIKSFKLTKYKCCEIQQTAEYRDIISTINDHKISHRETSTCLMLFCDLGLVLDNIATDWTSVIQERYNFHSIQANYVPKFIILKCLGIAQLVVHNIYFFLHIFSKGSEIASVWGGMFYDVQHEILQIKSYHIVPLF